MANIAEKIASYEDVLNAPDNVVAEIIYGGLETHPRPRPVHAIAYSGLTSQIWGSFGSGHNDVPGGWVILAEPEIHLGPHILVPDIAGWTRENFQDLPETPYIETPPDWVCEIISPSTARIDRGPKRDIYAEFKVPHLWFVDPEAKTLEAFELRGTDWVLLTTLTNDDEVAVAPFAAAPFKLDSLWWT